MIIDADYYNNPDNEGHIYFQVINLAPFDIVLRKGDTIGQGILKKYYLTDDDVTTGLREGGFGSTDIVDALNDIGLPRIEEPDYLQLAIDLFVNNTSSMAEDCVMARPADSFPYIVGKPIG